MRIPMAAFLAALALTAAARGQDGEDGVSRLVEELGSDEWAQRDRAAKELLAMGLAARPALRAALGGTDLEVVERAKDILRQIDEGFCRAALEEDGELLTTLLFHLEEESREGAAERTARYMAGADPGRIEALESALRWSFPTRAWWRVTLYLAGRVEGDFRPAILEIALGAGAMDPAGLAEGLAAVRPIAGDLALAFLRSPEEACGAHPTKEVARSLLEAAYPTADAQGRRRLLDFAAFMGEPSLATSLASFVPAEGADSRLLVATRAFLSDEASRTRGIDSLAEFTEPEARQRLLESLLTGARIELPPPVLAVALDPADPAREIAAAAVARLGSHDARARVRESLVANPTDEARQISALLSTETRTGGIGLVRLASEVQGSRAAALGTLALLCDTSHADAWGLLARLAREEVHPFSILGSFWPLHLSRQAGFASVPVLAAVALNVENSTCVRASAIRALAQDHPALAGPVLSVLSGDTEDGIAAHESSAILEWACRVGGETGAEVAGNLMDPEHGTDRLRQSRALEIIEGLGGRWAVAGAARILTSDYLEEYHPAVLKRAIAILRREGGAAAYEALLSLHRTVAYLPPNVGTDAMRALAELGPDDARTVEALQTLTAADEVGHLDVAADLLIELVGRAPGALPAALDRTDQCWTGEGDASATLLERVRRLVARSVAGDLSDWTVYLLEYGEMGEPAEAAEVALAWIRDLPATSAVPALWKIAVWASSQEIATRALTLAREKSGLALPDSAAGPSHDPDAVEEGQRLVEEWLAGQK
ncbi:MAG: hypothetical protein HY720_11060 [Planctomycetes bacterium]|nr:hypothetical protein [Planctomycetota bacterium]